MSKEFEKSLIIHKTFADICRAYQLFIRGELNEAEKKRDDYREEIDRQRDEFEREKEHIQEGVAQMIQEKDQRIAELETQLDGEQKEGLVLETRVQEVEQLAEERKTNMDELQQKCDELEQCMCHNIYFNPPPPPPPHTHTHPHTPINLSNRVCCFGRINVECTCVLSLAS